MSSHEKYRIVVGRSVREINLGYLGDDLPSLAALLADAEGDLLARQANHAHLSAIALDGLAKSKEGKRLPEHRLKAKLRANQEHYKREIEIAEAHRSVVFLRAVVQLLTQRSQ